MPTSRPNPVSTRPAEPKSSNRAEPLPAVDLSQGHETEHVERGRLSVSEQAVQPHCIVRMA